MVYADDVVLLAEGEDEMRSLIGRLEEYMEGKALELNVGKTKVMRFKRGEGRMKKREWRWRGKKMEVKEFRYLGYTLQRNGRQKAHIKERIKRAATIMGEIWGIGKRKFEKDWNRNYYDYLTN